ncbi:MAG TPA: hypothetical protein VKY74_11455 [Chloroflexia bacterium]|nr:hypothetical protein [Chloroflexia bacterium]
MTLVGHCLRCGRPFSGEFCPRCDQAELGRLPLWEVWHLVAWLPPALPAAEARRLWQAEPTRWVHVADVRTRGWEEVFEITNNTDCDGLAWHARAAVTLRIRGDMSLPVC